MVGKGGEGDGGGTGFNIHDGGDGGTASGGDVNRAGDGGGNAVRTSFAGVTESRPSYHANGGGSALGGMRRQPDMDVAGADGRSYGGGGTGCSLNASTTGKAGGDGAAGVVIVTEYYVGGAG